MSYNQPVSSRILVRSRVAQPATSAVLSAVSFSSVDIGSAYLSSGSPPTNFTCPYAGHYTVEYELWACGAGTGQVVCTSTRSATPVYDQSWIIDPGCFTAYAKFVIPNCQVGDVITMQANSNNTGGVVTSITTTTIQEQGRCTITFYPSN